jgi:hypothetical protein
LRVLHGRLKAVFAAILATIILVGILAPATTLASDPPGLSRFMYAVGRVESGGSYTARNPTTGAYGKYQIMPASWRAWASQYLGSAYAPQTPANQELVATAKFKSLFRWLGLWRRVAYWWLTGSDQTSGWSTYATSYVGRVMDIYYASATGTATSVTLADVRRYSDRSASITYAGSWSSASYAGYAGGTVRYSTRAGAKATFTFTGTRIVWYGPIGPTRGSARITIDGVYRKTVDLHRTSFSAHVAVYSGSWTTARQHTITIEVVGTAGHPMVAIDEFAVTN